MRAPEQGTGPNVFYLGVHEASIDPLAMAKAQAYLTEVAPSQQEKLAPLLEEGDRAGGRRRRPPAAVGLEGLELLPDQGRRPRAR